MPLLEFPIARLHKSISFLGFPSVSVVKNLPAAAGDEDLTPGSGRSPGEGNGNPLQYSCLGNPMDRGAWWATVHGVVKSRTKPRLNHHHHPLLQTLQPTEAEGSLDMTALILTLSSISWVEQCRGDWQFRGTSWPQIHIV